MSPNSTTYPPEIFGVIDPGAPLSIPVFVLGGAGFLLALFVGIYVVTHAADIAVRLASPATTFLQMIALAMMNAGVLLGIRRPLSAGWCLARLWTVQLGCAFLAASSLMKALRLYRHYRRSRHNPLKMSNEKFMWVLFVLMLGHVGILMYWTLMETVTASAGGETCISDGYYGEIAALSVLFVMGALWFCFALATAHLNHRLTEHAWVSASVALLAGGVSIFVSHAYLLTKTPDMFSSRTRLLSDSVCVFVVTGVMCVLCLHGKLWAAPPDEATAIEEARTFSSSMGHKRISSTSLSAPAATTTARKRTNEKRRRRRGGDDDDGRRRSSQYSSSAASGLTSHPSTLTVHAYNEDEADAGGEEEEDEY